MNPFDALRRKRFSSVLGIEHRRTEFPDPEVVIGIDPNLAVVGRPRIRIAHLLPRLALVLAAISSALLVLHDGINDVWVLAVNIQSDATGVSAIFVGQPLGQFLPGQSAIGGLVDRAVRSAAVESKGRAPPLIRRGI